MAEAVGHYGIFYLIVPSRLSDEKRKKFYSTLREVKSPKHDGAFRLSAEQAMAILQIPEARRAWLAEKLLN